MQEAAEINQEEAMTFLNQEPWRTNRMAGLRGYVKGISPNVDWRALSTRLIDLNADDPGPRNQVDRDKIETLVATQWAQRDLQTALNWFFDEQGRVGGNSRHASNVASVLASTYQDQGDQIFQWLEKKQSENHWDDQILVSLAQNLSYLTLEPEIGQLINMAAGETHRFKIVQSFARTRDGKSDGLLKHPPENLSELIKTTRLSETNQQTLLDQIAKARWED